MQEGFELVDPAAAKALLAAAEPSTRREGEALMQRGAVQELALERSHCLRGIVMDQRLENVELEYKAVPGEKGEWQGHCTCQSRAVCAHQAALMLELLALHSTTQVRRLSAGDPAAVRASASAASGRSEEHDLPRRLAEALKRALSSREKTYLAKVRTVYNRCRESRRITYWDFQELGLRLRTGYTWQRLEIWPEVPNSEELFWQYVAHEAAARHVAIPEFMQAITDLGSVEAHLADWRQRREVAEWKTRLDRIESTGSTVSALSGEVDLRLVIHPQELRAEWRRSQHAAFEPMKDSHLRTLVDEYENGLAALTPEAEWIFQALQHSEEIGGIHLRWASASGSALQTLSRLVRLPILESRIVSVSGQPLARPEAPLRWEMTPAANPADHYRVRLVQADGSPAPTTLAILPGRPDLFLTPEALFRGPAFTAQFLNLSQENRIPALALESAGGVGLLQQLGIELPERLRNRVRILPYQVKIHCELRPIWAGSKAEDCVFTIQAEAADGRRLRWSGHQWNDENPTQRRPSGRDEIIGYDRSALAAVQNLLEPLPLKIDAYNENLTVRVSKKFPELFSHWLQSLPPQISISLDGELASFAQANVAGRVKLDVTEVDIDWFDLRVVLDVTDTSLTKQELALLLKGKGAYVRLPGKGWRRFQFDVTPEEDERLARLGLTARELSAEPQRLHALQLADEAARKFLPAEQVERVQRRAAEIKARVTPDLPRTVHAELRPYQLEGFHFLAYLSTNRFGGILADDMGLGKTLQTLAWLTWLREQEPPTRPKGAGARRPILVVCPKSVMDNWRAETARFTPHLQVRVWSAIELEFFHEDIGTADIHVLNYNQLRTLADTLQPVHWQAVILDEGQYIKNPNSQTALVARALRTDHRLVLSGTPIENRLLDLWSLMSFAMPGVLGNRAQFARVYDSKTDPLARRRLASRVRPFLLRRAKAQVAQDLPDRVEEDLFCEMEGEQKLLYQAELKRARQMLLSIQTQKELAQQQFHFLVSLLRLRQICCDPRLLQPDSKASSAKIDALMEQLEPLMEEGQKVLVFSQFVELLDLLRRPIAERQWPVFYLAGDTENRGDLVRNFQAAEGAAVFLISLKAGGFGLNLTAASYVVLFDPWWNPAVENQAIDRTHRIGQTNKVMAYRLLIKNSVEEKIRALQKSKQALAQDVLGEERFAQSLTLSDLQFLFAD